MPRQSIHHNSQPLREQILVNTTKITKLQFLKTTVTIEMHQSPTTGELQMDSYTTFDPVRQTEASTEAANTLRSTSNFIVRQTRKIMSVVKRIAIFFLIP